MIEQLNHPKQTSAANAVENTNKISSSFLIWTGNSDVKEHIKTVGKHLHPFSQLYLKLTFILGGVPKTGILHEPVKNFISLSFLMDEFSVKNKRKV